MLKLKKILVGVVGVIFFFSMFGAGEAKNKEMLTYVVSPMKNLRILPTGFIPGVISNTISIVATPGEYEPGSFVLKALKDIEVLEVISTDLKTKSGKVIPSSNVDIKVVKCWYQGESAGVNNTPIGSKRVLIPELLLNDDSLVKVDYEKEENYIKVSYPEREKYICISKKKDFFSDCLRIQGRSVISPEAFPVKDSPILLPVDISKGNNKQFLVTVKVPENTPAGVYTGKINLITLTEMIGSITLKLKVLPFKLASPRTNYDLKKKYTSSIYYRGCLHPDWPKGSISEGYKSKKQLKRELEDLFAHGVTNPTTYQSISDEKLLGEVLRIRNEIGMDNQYLYYLGAGTGSWGPFTPEALAATKNRVKRAIEFTKPYGVTDFYVYGRDEATGEKLKSQRLAWEAVHEAGGKTFVSGSRKNFEVTGDIQDLLICAGYPSKEEAAKWHSVGHKIFCYANPQVGIEDPEIYRRNFGILLWKSNYDGAMDYTYCGVGFRGNVWNDFDGRYRDLVFAYPTIDGVIGTIQWEGYREAIDDIRYATTLRFAIEKAKKDKDRKKRKIALEAESYLKEVDVITRDLDTVRLEIISYILKLTEGGE